jgi:hypothetical protein
VKNCTNVILGVVLGATIHRKERKKVRKKVDLKHESNNNNTAQYFDGTYIGRYGSTHVLGSFFFLNIVKNLGGSTSILFLSKGFHIGREKRLRNSDLWSSAARERVQCGPPTAFKNRNSDIFVLFPTKS